MSIYYVPLRVHTNYGIGGSGFKEYSTRLLSLGIPGMGCVDSTFYGAGEFFTIFSNMGLKPIIGTEISIPFKMLILVKSSEGFKNYSRILSKPLSDSEILNFTSGLIFILFDKDTYDRFSQFTGDIYYGIEKENTFIPWGVKPVAVPRVFYAERGGERVSSLLYAIRNRKIYRLLNFDKAYIKGSEEMRNFPAEALKNTIEIYERVNFTPFSETFYLPHSEDSFLTELISTKGINSEERKRLRTEIEIIREKKLEGYFYVIKEINDFAKKKGIMINVRGSGAASFILYLMGVSHINPVAFKLPFERFLNRGRKDLPDVDIDVDFRRREEVFQFIRNRFGFGNTGYVSVVNRFEYRSAIREISRAFGIPPSRIEEAKRSGEYEDIKRWTERIIGTPSYISQHPAGIVITPGPLINYIPIKGELVQGDKELVEKMGLLKMDILGVRGFNGIVVLNPESFENKEVFRLIGEGKTIGCFQIESPIMRQILRDMKPETIGDIGIALAVIRPGAKEGGYRDIFLRRLRGIDEIYFPDESLKEILNDTLGVFIFQEQVMEALRRYAGFTMEEAEEFRRILTKERGSSNIERIKALFYDRSEKLGRSKISEVWGEIEKFVRYGFNKAHSMSYGYLAYLSMYSKVQRPLEFFKGILNAEGGYYPTFAYVDEARRWGVNILLPDVNRSNRNTEIENGSLRIGLKFIHYLSQKTINRIIQMRPFRSEFDFFTRVRPSVKEGEYIVKSGSLDSFGTPRRELFSILYTGKRVTSNHLKKEEWVKQEVDAMGFSSCHPLSIIERNIRISDIDDLYDGETVEIMGRVIGLRGTYTKNGDRMAFATLDDETGILECIFFPNAYKRANFSIGDIVKIKGRKTQTGMQVEPIKTGVFY